MQEANDLFDQFKKWVIVLLWSLLGVTARLTNLNKEKKLSKAQALSTVFAGIFAGFVANEFCEHYTVSKHLTTAFISISALSGEHLVSWILVNYTSFLNAIKKFTKKKE